jgi:hypothetical protein
LHFDGEESPSKEELVANGLSFMHTTVEDYDLDAT